MGKSKGRNKKKARAGAIKSYEEELKGCPHSFVFNRGPVGKNVFELIKEMRRVMEPFTASHLKAHRKNVLKDFVSVAGPLNVSHFIMFSKTDTSTNLRIARIPRGPTLTFQVTEYCLARDVVTSQRKPHADPKQFNHHPLLVMNNFSGEGMHLRLMTTMFQNMFPSINVNKVKLKKIRRCVLLNYDAETKTIDFRHYHVRAAPSGMSRSVKKLLKAKVPNLGKYDDVSEYMTRGDVSESEGELDDGHNEVILPQGLSGRGNIKANKSAIRLTEIGPRLTLRLVKIEEGVAEGNVLYHEFVNKTDAEIAEAAKRRQKNKKLKEERKKKQEADIKKKAEMKEEHKQRSLAGMKRKADDTQANENPADDEDSEEDDREYFKQEVGEEPEPELFPTSKNGAKKRKISSDRREKGLLQNKKKGQLAGKQNKDKSLDANKHKGAGKFSKKTGNDTKDKSGKFSKKTGEKPGQEKKQQKKKTLTVMDKMRRSKQRKEKRMNAKKIGKRANKPRKC